MMRVGFGEQSRAVECDARRANALPSCVEMLMQLRQTFAADARPKETVEFLGADGKRRAALSCWVMRLTACRASQLRDELRGSASVPDATMRGVVTPKGTRFVAILFGDVLLVEAAPVG